MKLWTFLAIQSLMKTKAMKSGRTCSHQELKAEARKTRARPSRSLKTHTPNDSYTDEW